METRKMSKQPDTYYPIIPIQNSSANPQKYAFNSENFNHQKYV